MTGQSPTNPVEGYEAIEIQDASAGWGGLEKSGPTFLDGSVASGSWFFAVGSFSAYGDGFPGFGNTVKEVELYVISKSTCASAPGYDKHEDIVNVPYAGHSYSSTYNDDSAGTGHGRGQLDSALAWTAKSNDAEQWMLLDLGKLDTVGGVVTQGRHDSGFRVTSYTVSVSLDGSTWSAVDDGATFAGNTDSDESKSSYFESPVAARFVRIEPKEWDSYISMRAGLIVPDYTGARCKRCGDAAVTASAGAMDSSACGCRDGAAYNTTDNTCASAFDHVVYRDGTYDTSNRCSWRYDTRFGKELYVCGGKQ